MSAFEKRVKADELVDGMTLYPLFSVTGSVADMESPVRVGVHRELVLNRMLSQYALKEATYRMVSSDERNFFYRDYNINFERSVNSPDKQYNFHALFKTEADAVAAMNEINSGQLSPELSAVRDRLVKAKQFDRDTHDDQW